MMSNYFWQWGWFLVLALAAGALPVLVWAAVSPMSTWHPGFWQAGCVDVNPLGVVYPFPGGSNWLIK